MIKSIQRKLAGYFLVGGLFFGMGLPLVAQEFARPVNSASIYMGLQKLQVLGSVLYVAAHPDDENNTLLPFLAKEKHYRTAYLSLTRGDGGQNLIGPEQGVALGLIRTRELQAARAMDGAEQYFSAAYEFGFSKSFEETLSIWDREKVLGDMVKVIRQFQPDIIINRFPPDARAGHGHHAASAVLSIEAYAAAADPNRFPEQLQSGLKVWQAKRLLWNTFNFGGTNTTAENQLKLDVGAFNPLLGKAYGELGAEARTQHKSQGEGRPRRKGPLWEYFLHLSGDPAQKGLLDGVDLGWARLGEKGAAIGSMVAQLVQRYSFQQPEQSLPGLVEVLTALQTQLPASVWKTQKEKEVLQLIQDCAGLVVEATTDQAFGVPGQALNIQFLVNQRSGEPLVLQQVQLLSRQNLLQDSTVQMTLLNNQNWQKQIPVQLPPQTPLSQPYWLEAPMTNAGTFAIKDENNTGKAWSDPVLEAVFVLSYKGHKMLIRQPVQHKYVDPVKGELYQPLHVVAPFSLHLNRNVLLTQVKRGPAAMAYPVPLLQVTANTKVEKSSIRLQLSDAKGKTVWQKDTVLTLEPGAVAVFPLTGIDPAATGSNALLYPKMSWQTAQGTQVFDQHLNAIEYDHIPHIYYAVPEKLQVVAAPIQTLNRRIGFVEGAGDYMPEALAAMGYAVTTLKEENLTAEQLQQLDVLVVGIRAFNLHEWLTNKNEILNQFVAQGGHLVVQYLKSNQVGNKRIKLGPFPFAMSGVRVTEENAAVGFAQPNHPLLQFPNKITSSDFDQWVQERSTYQMEPVTPPYVGLLSMNDKNEKPTLGSWVTAPHGKGHITYVSLVLFRQLPVGNPGAYRILANLMAYGATNPLAKK